MKNLIYITIVIVSLSACNDVIFEEDLASRSPKENFEYLWRECDEKYSFFDIKEIDWDEVYNRYEPRITEDMLDELRDDYINLILRFNILVFDNRVDGPDNFDFRIVTDNYLPRDYFRTGPFQHDFIADGEIGYIRFGAFTGGVSDFNLNFMLSRYRDTQGIILDMRENGGGAVSDVFDLLSHFIDERTKLYESRIKNGPGRDDFSALEPAFLNPSGGVNYTGKVMVLVDRGTFSAGSFTSLAIKEIPHMVLMGDTTGGGLGLPNGGSLNGDNYENGVPPDIIA